MTYDNLTPICWLFCAGYRLLFWHKENNKARGEFLPNDLAGILLCIAKSGGYVVRGNTEYGKEEPLSKDVREIGGQAVWSVTSAKPGNGVELLRDGKIDTYWQSDGTQPHLVNMQFQKKMLIQELHLYLDYKLDESYTPNKIAIRAGNSFYDLKEISQFDFDEPQGWISIRLEVEKGGGCLKALLLQIAVLSNHQNGRDTHIRQIKIYGPRMDPIKALGYDVNFTSKEILSYAYVR